MYLLLEPVLAMLSHIAKNAQDIAIWVIDAISHLGVLI